jgi:hypothetical protein
MVFAANAGVNAKIWLAADRVLKKELKEKH